MQSLIGNKTCSLCCLCAPSQSPAVWFAGGEFHLDQIEAGTGQQYTWSAKCRVMWLLNMEAAVSADDKCSPTQAMSSQAWRCTYIGRPLPLQPGLLKANIGGLLLF